MRSLSRPRALLALVAVALLAAASADWLTAAPEPPSSAIELQLPLGRRAYQTNEDIEFAVVRAADPALAATEIVFSLAGEDGSKLSFIFPVAAAQGRGTEHLAINGRLLRPGKYTVDATAGGATARQTIDVHSHVRKSSFRLVDWGSRAKDAEQGVLGEDGMGFNLVSTSYGGLNADELVRGGLDYMWCCTMSGGHQMDLRMECDWSDPLVVRGGTARVVRRAFQDRTNPNCVGVHFYDEPGLTWHKHPKTGEFTPHNLPAQDLAFRSAFGREPLQYNEVKPSDPKAVAEWTQRGRWKMAFLEAAWRDAAFGVRQVRPDFVPANQAVYGWNAYADGYYFNVSRALPVMNGHGGYDDLPGGYFAPGYCFEFGRMRDLDKPNWYLPTWYAGMPPDRFRLEQYLSFMGNLQGMMKPPDMQVHRPGTVGRPTSEGIVESNRLMARLGTVFTTMSPTRPPVAVLYSLSQSLGAQVRDMKDNYEGAGHGRQKTLLAYLGAKSIQHSLFPIVEEDVADGTLAAHHKAVLLPGIDYLEPGIIRALEAFAASGGTVIVSDESKVKIKGAVPLGCAIDTSLFDRLGKAWQAQNHAELAKLNTVGAYMVAARPVADALQKHFTKLGIEPPLKSSAPGIVVSRQASGDIEYLFAANATYDADLGGHAPLKPAEATLTIPADNRPVYDAIDGGPADFKAGNGTRSATFRFGPGQMRVFARTARPIGKVIAATPVIDRDFTRAVDPIRLTVAATLTDANGRVLSGSAPLHIKVIDPLGVVRYDLFRATKLGQFQIELPLAANDAAGEWKVVVKELLASTEDAVPFAYKPAAQCPAVSGRTPRAVSFGNDRDNVYRFFRNHKEVTIATGAGDYKAAAGRLAKALEPLGVKSTIVTAASINKPRPISDEEAKTWVGLDFGKATDQARKNPGHVGFDVRGAVILLGTPEDNPLIAFLQKYGFLPYRPKRADFPGKGRGMIAWQRDGVGLGQESVTLIAYDSDGMGEAVGSLYEFAAGLEPLTPRALPTTGSITSATTGPAKTDAGRVVWKMTLPDRAIGVKPLPNGRLVVLAQDGTLALLDEKGQPKWRKVVPGGEAWALDVSADGKLIAVGASQTVAGFDASGKELFRRPLGMVTPPPVVTYIAVAPDGSRIAAGGNDGSLTIYDGTGKPTAALPGVNRNDPKAKPNPFLSAAFAKDGKTLVALMANEAQVISAADVKVIQKVGGVNGVFPPQRVGEGILVTDGRAATVLNPTDGKVLSRTPLPPETVALATSGDDLIAGTEVTGTVRKLRPATGNAKEQTFWDAKAERRVVKKVVCDADGRIAVAYWGGLVRVLNGKGEVIASRTFEQDVADLAWAGKTLVVAPANGKVLGLGVK